MNGECDMFFYTGIIANHGRWIMRYAICAWVRIHVITKHNYCHLKYIKHKLSCLSYRGGDYWLQCTSFALKHTSYIVPIMRQCEKALL